MTWRVPWNARLTWRSWDGEYVVFSSLSGNTHMLDIVTGEVLRTIARGESEEQAVCAHIARFLEVERDRKLDNMVENALINLEAEGLAESVAQAAPNDSGTRAES